MSYDLDEADRVLLELRESGIADGRLIGWIAGMNPGVIRDAIDRIQRFDEALTAEQARALKLLEAERGTWRTPRELDVRGTTLWSLHKLGIVERQEIGPNWHAYRIPPRPSGA